MACMPSRAGKELLELGRQVFEVPELPAVCSAARGVAGGAGCAPAARRAAVPKRRVVAHHVQLGRLAVPLACTPELCATRQPHATRR